MNNHTRICIAALLCPLVTSLSCTPSGQRLLTVQIESGGTVIYEGIRGVSDDTPVVEMWDVIGDVSFECTATENNDGAEDDETNARILKDAVVIRINHVNEELASALLEKITLRCNDAETSWSLDAAEVARVKETARE